MNLLIVFCISLLSLTYGQGQGNGNCNNGFDAGSCAAVSCLADPCQLNLCQDSQNCEIRTDPCQCCPAYKCVGQGKTKPNGKGSIDCALVRCADPCYDSDGDGTADICDIGETCTPQNGGGCCDGAKCN
mmetsp:Transcript_29636/g.26210  ORF Transcript_29636/g.26210 Transcript_29636/m.26210 type:complete len:129 (+) Transcript_29636:2-388(+)